jgi:hypothetical protein
LPLLTAIGKRQPGFWHALLTPLKRWLGRENQVNAPATIRPTLAISTSFARQSFFQIAEDRTHAC